MSNEIFKMNNQAPDEMTESITKTKVGFRREITGRSNRQNNLQPQYELDLPYSKSVEATDSLFVSPNSSLNPIPEVGQDSPLNYSDSDLSYAKNTISPMKSYSEKSQSRESSNMPFEDLIQYSQKKKNDLRNPRNLSGELLDQGQVKIFDKRNEIVLSPKINSHEATSPDSVLDTHKEKRALKESLLQEIKQVQADIALADSENERLNLTKANPRITLPIKKEVLSMLARVFCPEKESEDKTSRKTIFQNLQYFLPFSSRRIRLSRLDLKTNLDEKVNMPSYFPQSVENPLSYLQTFTPLIWSSKITSINLPPTALETLESNIEMALNNKNLLQQQIITASHSQGLFFARLILYINPITRSIYQLSSLNIPLCAEHELGSFIRSTETKYNYMGPEIEKAQSTFKKISEVAEFKSPINREVGVICYAIGRWLQVSLRRARFWWLISKLFSTPEARKKFLPLYSCMKSNTQLQKSKSKKRKRKIKRVAHEIKDFDDESEVESSDFSVESHQNAGDISFSDEVSRKSGNFTRKDLLPHLGRSFLCISKSGCSTCDSVTATHQEDDSHIEILFEWRLSFDWMGEIKSHITAIPKVPKFWHKSQKTHFDYEFEQIPLIFEGLLHEKGPLIAVASLISLTMAEEEE
ncbi:hypothetical protein EV44_g2967 [Erysiphe necator]|uniref:Uncharacterized protein n=1 Tax=Uncinula necator TaxID=52586 RepID=A0A0B1NZJ7_UNCNE|nr:hypothetical protein EV44_g2967 [Erysiphe necator]